MNGGADGQLLVSSGSVGLGDSLTVGGLRARKQYTSSEHSCAVGVTTTGATDPAEGDLLTEPGVRVWFLSTPGLTEQQTCDAASRLANALVHALPKA